MTNDSKEFVYNCPSYTKVRSTKSLKPKIISIKTNGPKISYVIDGWKLHNIINIRTGYSWVIDVIDHFSKFMWPYPVLNNNATNVLKSLKQFIYFFGVQEILQNDNGSEYKNDIISQFCSEKSIKYIFSSPYEPSTNSIVEVVQKEIRRHVILDFLDDEEDFDLNNSRLEVINIHNNNMHSTTGYKPIDLFTNTSKDIYNEVNNNIDKVFKNKNKYFNEVNKGNKLLVKKGTYAN